MSFLLKNIIEFINVLRLTGVRVSTSETLDAIQSLKFIDISDRIQVKTALSACLSKSEQENVIFSETFDKFFINSEDKRAYIEKELELRKQKKEAVIEKVSELKFQDEAVRIKEDLQEVYAALPEEERQSIIDFLSMTSKGKNVKPQFKPIVENMLEGKLNKLKQKYGDLIKPEQTIPKGCASEAGIIAGDVLEEVRRDNELLFKNLSQISDEEVPKVIRLIKLITQRLKKSIARRYKSSNKKESLDFRKTIHLNLATGNVQFRLKFKKRPKHKEKICMLCDVSASMYRFSGFALQFIIGMHSGAIGVESYIFSQDTEHIKLDSYVNAASFEQQVKRSPVWKQGTNINKALEYILGDARGVLNSSTIVIVVSDAKTIDSDKTIDSLKKLQAKVKRILWLNPVNEAEWGRTTGIYGYKKYSKMLDSSSLDRLSKACESL
jgi:uncharacterized protein